MSSIPAKFSKALQNAQPDQVLALLCQADAAGLLLAPGENIAEFTARLHRLDAELQQMAARESDYQELLQGALPLPEPLTSRATQLTELRYRFAANWLPAYFSTPRTGRLSAGILYEIDDEFPLIFLQSPRPKPGLLRYSPEEILAHEMVHAARIGFKNSRYDEYFPWQLSDRKWRRAGGNLFRRWTIPLAFFAGIFVPLLDWAFRGKMTWSLGALLLTAGVVIREMQGRHILKVAAQKLAAAGIAPRPALLRLTDREIARLGAKSCPDVTTYLASEWRGKIILARFKSL